MIMTMYPGLPLWWAGTVLLGMAVLMLTMLRVRNGNGALATLPLARLPAVGPLLAWLSTRPHVLKALRLTTAVLFLLLIGAGLFGNPIPERNLATVVTWTFWWTGVVISALIVGSAWCAICPWDALANLLVRHRIWGVGASTTSLAMRAPKWLRTTWPALALFAVLTWLELGFGITRSPYATAVLALTMVVMATVSMALFERRTFCHTLCPVGRTLGAYGTVAPLALRPIDNDVCAECRTLECYHGSGEAEPCPTHLVMGRLQESTFCISCGACAVSCPQRNVSWRVRSPGSELASDVRPRWDHGWFILGLVALTSFHGFTMMPFWERWISRMGQWLGDSGQLLVTFTIGMGIAMALPMILFAGSVWLTRHLMGNRVGYRRLFGLFALPALPLAFGYHLAHNLTHLVQESRDILPLLKDPMGSGLGPLSHMERMMRIQHPWLPMDALFALQAGFLILAFWLALRVLSSRVARLNDEGHGVRFIQVLPVTIFLVAVSLLNLWLLTQPMTMRM